MQICKSGRTPLRTLFAVLGTGALLNSIGAQAQEKPSPVIKADVPCEQGPQPEPPEMAAIAERMLTPGVTFNPAKDLLPLLPKIQALQKVEAERAAKDWANLCKYAAKNTTVRASGQRPDVVFIGDSITEAWEKADPSFFGATVIDRGISGQTTPQMVLRMYPDVVNLRPAVVHIMAGTNDVAGNTGPVSDETILNNIRAMIDIAQANGIEVVLGSIPPTNSFFWNPVARPAARIQSLNRQLRQLADKRRVVWVDYHAKLTDAAGGLPAAFGNDGVHPNRNGYAVMRPLTEKAIAVARR